MLLSQLSLPQHYVCGTARESSREGLYLSRGGWIHGCGRQYTTRQLYCIPIPHINNSCWLWQITLKRLSEQTGCRIVGKAEFQNPGGSVKDRAALGVVRDAEERGLYVFSQ